MPRFVDISGTAPIAAALDARTAIGASGQLITSVKDYGAVGDGVTDDTMAINNAFATAGSLKAVYFPPGNYVYNGTGLSSNYPRIVGAHEATTITLGASSYLINSGLYFYSLLLRDVKIVNGKGAIKHTYGYDNENGTTELTFGGS